MNALLTPIIALGVGAVGFFQWRTAERKRRQDLFDRRFDFFKMLWSTYEDYVTGADKLVDEFDLMQFSHEAEFLFGADISKHMLAMLKRAREKSALEYEWFAKPFRKYLVIEPGFWR